MTAFLARPLVGMLATLRANGSPHVAPVWFEFADGCFLVFTHETFQRGAERPTGPACRDLGRNP